MPPHCRSRYITPPFCHYAKATPITSKAAAMLPPQASDTPHYIHIDIDIICHFTCGWLRHSLLMILADISIRQIRHTLRHAIRYAARCRHYELPAMATRPAAFAMLRHYCRRLYAITPLIHAAITLPLMPVEAACIFTYAKKTISLRWHIVTKATLAYYMFSFTMKRMMKAKRDISAAGMPCRVAITRMLRYTYIDRLACR